VDIDALRFRLFDT